MGISIYENVIVKYTNIDNAIANKQLPGSTNLSHSGTPYLIKKGTDNTKKFEIEGIGFPVNNLRMWFNTNEGIIRNATEYDGGIYTESQDIK